MPVGAAPSRSECVAWLGHRDTRISECVATFDGLTRHTEPGLDAAIFVRQALVAFR